MRTLLSLLFAAALLLTSGCAFYQRYPMPQSRLTKIKTDNLSFYLLDPSRPLSGVWYVDAYRFEDEHMRASISRLSEREAYDVVTVRDARDARASRNDVLIYVKPQAARRFPDTLTLDLRYDQLEKVEVCEVNYGKTLGVNFISYIAAGLALSLLSMGD
ncbi:MAG TPA: hypothetical protein PKD78_15425 [Saprospiraceae bacterium]|nr:hypothetical protein [Saprospiraceae bacterium]